MAEVALALISDDIRSRGVGEFVDALACARAKVAKMSDEQLRTALFQLGEDHKGRKNSGVIKVQPTAPGRRASTSRGRAPVGKGRPRSDGTPAKRQKLPHNLQKAIEAGRRGSYKR